MREKNPGYTGQEEFNYFLSVLFPHDQLMIMPYNRVVKDLNGLDKDGFMDSISQIFDVAESSTPVDPDIKGQVGMYIDGQWYRLNVKDSIVPDDVVGRLDGSVLQDRKSVV